MLAKLSLGQFKIGYIFIYFTIPVSLFSDQIIRSVRMNQMVTVLPGFQRFSLCQVLFVVLVTLTSKVGGDGDGVVDREKL